MGEYENPKRKSASKKIEQKNIIYFPAPRDKRGESEKMRLCKKNAEKLVGKKVDRRRRIFGYYPIEIIKINGELYAKDAAGVCSPIPESENDFNCYNYDFVIN